MGRLTHTVSGGIASFRTPSKVPIESLKFHFLPKQEGSGYASPTNIRNISGWTGLNGRQEGKNLIDVNALTGTTSVWWKGKVVTGYPNHCVTPKIPVKPGATYTLNRISYAQDYVCYFDKNGDYVGQETWNSYVPSRTIPDNVYFVGITIGTEYLNNPYPQFELGSVATSYVPFRGAKSIPVMFPDGQTIYGGYYDPVVGEIVATHKRFVLTGYEDIAYSIYDNSIYTPYSKKDILADSKNGTTISGWSNMFNQISGRNLQTYYIKKSYDGYGLQFYYAKSYFNLDELTVENFVAKLKSLNDSGNPLTIVYELATPIHIPVTPQDLKAFLDHNNFWSDTNDITEVTYSVCDSNMILQTKKNIIAENSKHYRKVLWNQWLPPLDENGWKAYTTSYTTATFSDGIATNTWLTDNSGYSTSIRDKNGTRQYAGEIWYASYMVKTSVPNLQWGLEMCGGNQLRYITRTQSDVWKQCSAVSAYNRGTTNYTYICNLSTADGDQTGIVAQVASPILVNLTAMFGPGNEPTKKEFEALCKINHVDLTQYQPQTSGTEQIWCIPSINLDDYITVEWNQWAPEVNANNWQAYDSNKLSLLFNNGVVTQTWLSVGSGYAYSICTKNLKRHVINRYYYLSYEYCTDFVGRLYGTVGGVSGNSVDTIANTWQRYSCLIQRINGGNMDNYIAYIGRFANNTGIEIGSTCQMRNPIAIDITQMFGAGNEPKSTAEFEYLCTINNINLTEYHAYNSGTKIIWKI